MTIDSTLVHDLSTDAGYFARYYELLYQHREAVAPCQSAWAALEKERLDQTGRNRFKYGSFRVTLCRRNHGRREVVNGKML